MLLLSFILSFSNNCHKDINYISDKHSLDRLSNCTNLDGNLFINGGNNLDNLEPLLNLENISGNLVILDNHNLRTLYGLNNLKNITGNELYLDRYSVVIKFNINELDDNHEGLCYANRINWSLITTSNIDIRNNGIDCPECHPECIGCWGPGPIQCQICRNYKYYNICVSRCPGNFSGTVCDNIYPKPPILNYSLYDLNNINLTWIKSNLNDYINGFNVYINQDLYFTNINSNLGYYEDDLDYFYDINDLEYGRFYNLSVTFLNDLGESNMSNIISIETGIPSTSATTIETTSATTTETTSATTTETASATTTETTSATTTETTSATTTETTSGTTTETTSGTTTDTTSSSTITDSSIITNTENLNITNESSNDNDILLIILLILLPIIIILIIICFYVYCFDCIYNSGKISPEPPRVYNNRLYDSNRLNKNNGNTSNIQTNSDRNNYNHIEGGSLSSNSNSNTYSILNRNNLSDVNYDYPTNSIPNRIIHNEIYASPK
jgi:hypothetical protein